MAQWDHKLPDHHADLANEWISWLAYCLILPLKKLSFALHEFGMDSITSPEARVFFIVAEQRWYFSRIYLRG